MVALIVIALLAFVVFGDGFSGVADEPAPTETVPEVADVLPTAENKAKPTAVPDQPVEEPAPIVVENDAAPTAVPVDTTIPHGDILFRGFTITVTLNDLTPLDDGFVYTAWLTEPEAAPLALGAIEADGSEIAFAAADGSDVLMNFSGLAIDIRIMFWNRSRGFSRSPPAKASTPDMKIPNVYLNIYITTEPESDAEPVFSSPIVYQAQADEQVISDYRQLKIILGVAIDQAIRDKMVAQANSFTDHTAFSFDDILNNGSLDGGKRHAEHAINLASGVASDDFFDWDGNGRAENPGDDVGLLPYARLFANAVTIVDADTADQVHELITQIESHVSLMAKITASDTLDEAAVHAAQLNDQQGQILAKIIALLEATQTIDLGTRFEVFATGN